MSEGGYRYLWDNVGHELVRVDHPSPLLRKFYGYRTDLLKSGEETIEVGSEGRRKSLDEINNYIKRLEEYENKWEAETAADIESVGGNLDKLKELLKKRWDEEE